VITSDAQREYQRRYHAEQYANDPEYREEKKRRSRDYAAAARAADPEGEREKVRSRMRRWREENPEEYRAAKIRHRKNSQARNKAYVYGIKATTPCADCGRIYEPICMDFDHVSGEKEANVSLLMGGTWSLKKIQAEIAKCEVVCGNCHRIRTRDRFKAQGVDIEEVMP